MALIGKDDSVYATVAVIDMVAYSSTARLLEENSGAAVVAELNRQIQDLISAGLAVVPDAPPRPVVKTTGDGAIMVFDSGQQAHLFAEAVQLGALRHNQSRTEPSAMRWFRIGIATGHLSKYSAADGDCEYAGVTISNAVRLEGAARPGQIVMDFETFRSLPPPLQKCYGPEESASGKRSERYVVRKYQVISQEFLQSRGSTRRVNRRQLLTLTAGAGGLTVAAAWFAWPEMEAHLNPLPEKRFVALMAWPRSSQENEAIVAEVLASIGHRLAQAETYTRDLLIISSSDLTLSGARLDKPIQAASALGANLILAASLHPLGRAVSLELQVLESESSRVLRKANVLTDRTAVSGLAAKASTSAARLLGVPTKELKDTDELSGASAAVYVSFSQAKQLIDQPNDVGRAAGIEKLQQTLSEHPHFALGYAEIAIAYAREYSKYRDAPALELAASNAERALHYNPNSARGLLSQALVHVCYGRAKEALDFIARALQADPGSPEILLYKARVFRDLNRLAEEAQVYRGIIRDRPNYWPAYNELGLVLYRQALYKAAALTLEKASVVAPRVALPLTNLALMYLEMKQSEKAVDAANRSIRRNPTEYAYLVLGDVAFQNRDYKASLGYYEKAREINPKYDLIWRNIGDCYAMFGQFGKVLESYRTAAAVLSELLQTNPLSGFNWMTLAFYDAKIGEREKAVSEIASAESRGADDLQSQFLKVQTLVLLGRREEAMRLLLTCLRKGLSPVFVELALDLKDLRTDPRYIAQAGRSKHM